MPRIDIEAIEDEWEEGPSGPRHPDRHPRRSKESLSVAARSKIASHDVGRVLGTDRGHVLVRHEGTTYLARYGGAMRGQSVVVGDRVRVKPPRHDTDHARVLERLPRDTVLLRTGKDTVDDERVVVANADQVAVVVAADYLEGGVGLVDRVLVAASAGGLEPLIVVNKMDLADEREVADVEARYEGLEVPVLRLSARTGEGLDDLLLRLAGRWTAFTGHSGVGKTSLFNRLVPDADREVGEVGPRGGRHITVSSRAMHIEEVDAWLVDTPGIRAFGLGVLGPEELAAHFPELAALECDLDDCIHEDEPGCALEHADIHPERLASYRRLLASMREGDDV
jgi:ribosome biogenesis GTPase